MSALDIFKVNKIKAELEACKFENEKLRKVMAETESMTIFEIKQEISLLSQARLKVDEDAKQNLEKWRAAHSQAEKDLAQVRAEIENRKNEIVQLDEEILLQSFGFYKMKYPFNNSVEYRIQIERIRDQQAQMIKDGKAAICSTSWQVHGNAKEGARMTADYLKLIIRSFNNECDASIVNVKFNNIESIEKKIRKAYETLNKLGARMSMSLSYEYLNLKLQELYLCHEYQVKKQQEKEEQKRIKEEMREEAKLLREIEEEKLRIEKEAKHFAKALQQINIQLMQASSEIDKAIYLEKKTELEVKLAGLEKDKLNVFNREQNTRAGYVYIISNIGSFGEDVFKIGVTRRLTPEDRIDELGDASVPFDFDIHAMIFSEDAPKLELALHRAFENRKLNMINIRREFFKVSLAEIEAEVRKNFNKAVEFTQLAQAEEFRQSLALKQNNTSPN